MAKKKTSIKKNNKIVRQKVQENILPQNIVFIGEHVEEDKNIYICQQVYKEIHKFTKNKTTNESGGMLVGTVIDEFGKTNIVISGFVEAKYCEATPTTLKFTHETWEYCHKEIDRKFSGKKIVGWIHTHPDYGIFLSEYDKFIHENFFSEEHQLAYVVDPIQNIEGFYFWINGKIERCKGFYVYDKTGVKITIDNEEEETRIEKAKRATLDIKSVVIVVLAIAVFFLVFSNVSMNQQIKTLQQQQETLVESANNSINYMQQQINSLSTEVSALKEQSVEEENLKNDTARNGEEPAKESNNAQEEEM